MNIAIVGVGLIGGSVAITLKEKGFKGKVIGVDKKDEHLKKAIERKLIDEALPLNDAIKSCKIILLTVPVDAIKALLPIILDQVTDQVVIEYGSTKVRLLENINQHVNRGRLVAAHPMAGTEYSGPEAAISNLFKDKIMIYCEATQSDEDAFEAAEMISDFLEMQPTFMNAQEHDTHTAYVSHISHITSFALALTVLEKEKSQGRIFELASSGFESTVRLAKSSAEMWTPIFLQNKENVVEVLEEHISQLQGLLDALKNEDGDKMKKLIKKANKIKRILK